MAAAFVSCRQQTDVAFEHGKTPVVQIGHDVLYEEEIRKAIPIGLNMADSAAFADRYIRNWAQDVLFYQNAIRNIPDTREIDLLTENFRRSLFEHEYQDRLIQQKFSMAISDSQVDSFYRSNPQLFTLDHSMVKGLFLKIPVGARELQRIRKIYQKTDDESFEEIEKYGIRNAAQCEFFYDNWRNVAELEMLLPVSFTPLEGKLEPECHFEFSDDEFIYLINISQVVPKGKLEPLDNAESRIRGLLSNSNEVEYMRSIKEGLYNYAIDNNRIIFHKKNAQK